MKISVITVNYNNNEGLKKTINSVIRQQYDDYEFVIVDGNSTDGSKDTLSSLGESVTYISERDSGIYEAMNKGVRLAKGEYCIFMNSGDEFKDDYVLCNISNELKYDIVVGIGQWGETDKMIYPPEEQELSVHFFIKSALHHQSAFIKRLLLLRFPYDETYKIASDTIFFFKSLIVENCSYKKTNVIISKAEPAGVSCNLDKSLSERFHGIKASLPPRFRYDVDRLIYCSSSVCDFVYLFMKNIRKSINSLKQ